MPVQIAVWLDLGVGTLFPVDVGTQESKAGLYRPPVFKQGENESLTPPNTIISNPVHIAVWFSLPMGALVIEVGTQASLTGS